MIDKILVPLDGSALAERALNYATRLAEGGSADVVLLRVPIAETINVSVPEAFGGYAPAWPARPREEVWAEAATYLDDQAANLARAAISARALMAEGDPASVIVDRSAQEGVDLIVMSTHGFSGLTRWVLGSVAERVVQAMPCPVMIVRSDAPPESMLIPLDGSALSERALDLGAEVARRLGTEVTLLRAVADPDVDPVEIERLEKLERGLGARMREEQYDQAESYLRALAKARFEGRGDVRAVVAAAPAAGSICDYVDMHGIDLVVMATHGRTGFQRWVHGSVTQKVLRDGSCSMLVVPSIP